MFEVVTVHGSGGNREVEKLLDLCGDLHTSRAASLGENPAVGGM